MNLPNVALSLRQPWAHAVIYGGKPLENRLKWKNSHFRGPFLIHAAKGMTRDEWQDAKNFSLTRRCAWVPPNPWRIDSETGKPMVLERGGIVGIAHVVGVVDPNGPCVRLGEPQYTEAQRARGLRRPLRPDEDRWWMGGFALVLDNVRPLPFVSCKGKLGFFKVPDDVLARLDIAEW